MASKSPFKTTFEADQVIRPIFTGGAVALDNGARVLATSLGEDVIFTDLKSGKHLGKVEGDGEQISTLTRMGHFVGCKRYRARTDPRD